MKGVPVPQVAEVFERRSPDPAEEAIVVYNLPSTVDLIVLNEWYGKYLPIGVNWQEWEWCGIQAGGENNLIMRTSRHPVEGNLLSVGTGGQNGAGLVLVTLGKKRVDRCP